MSYSSIPTGYRAVPFETGSGWYSWRIAVLIREGGAGGAELVTLANVPGARAFLGCVLDPREVVREWLQIWVQNLEDFDPAGGSLDGQISSEQMDHQWRCHWEAVREVATAAVVADVPEKLLRPLYLDPAQWRVVCPATPQGAEWTLCRNDQKLGEAGLPKYSESTARFLTAPDAAGAAQFVTADERAPLTGAARQRSAELGFRANWVPINPQGGSIALRGHPPLDFSDYLDLLGGATIAEIGARKRECEAALLYSILGTTGRQGRRHGLLLSGTNGAELFYLKLRLVLQAGGALLAHLRQQQCPLLNLDPASFGILPGACDELPWPWMTRCELLRPGRALKFKIANTEEVRFVALGDSGAPAYCPGGRSRRENLMAIIHPVRVTVDEQQQVTIEGRLRLASPEPIEPSDVIRFRFSEGQISGEFSGPVITAGAAVRNELEFRTWPRPLAPRDLAQVKRFEGRDIHRCWCELIPGLSSPYDFYSLSILGAHALLVHGKNPLMAVKDEWERLGRGASEMLPAGAGLDKAVPIVARLLATGDGFGCLAPKHLFGGLPDSPAESDLPPILWAEALTILLRLMPGLGALSLCSDFGAAPYGSLHLPLQEPIAALENLSLRVRSLVFSDWNANREVRAVLAALKDSA